MTEFFRSRGFPAKFPAKKYLDNGATRVGIPRFVFCLATPSFPLFASVRTFVPRRLTEANEGNEESEPIPTALRTRLGMIEEICPAPVQLKVTDRRNAHETRNTKHRYVGFVGCPPLAIAPQCVRTEVIWRKPLLFTHRFWS